MVTEANGKAGKFGGGVIRQVIRHRLGFQRKTRGGLSEMGKAFCLQACPPAPELTTAHDGSR